jgi:hypothetical protein
LYTQFAVKRKARAKHTPKEGFVVLLQQSRRGEGEEGEEDGKKREK